MKNSLLLPLCLSLALVGCSRTSTSSTKIASTDQVDPNRPTYNDQAITAKNNAAAQSQVATTPAPAPMLSKDITAAAAQTPTAPDASTTAAVASTPTIAATSTPAMPDTAQTATTPATPAPVATPEASSLSAVASTSEAKPDLAARLTEWKLKPDDLRSDLASKSEVIRERTAGAGEPTGPMDGLIITQISSKLKDETTTSSLAIDVSADKGVVTLKGSAQSLEQIGNAIAIALDTPGVVKTVSQIKLEGTP